MKERRLHIGLSVALSLLLPVQGGFHFHDADDASSHGGHAHCFVCSAATSVEAAGLEPVGPSGLPPGPDRVVPPCDAGAGLRGAPFFSCIRSPPSA